MVKAPHRFFEPELTLVGRQVHIKIDSPWWNPFASPRVVIPDLLGVDAKGRLVIIEIKAKRATAAAVSQGENYRKVLDKKKNIPKIVQLIEVNSAKKCNGIEPIHDFALWYKAQYWRRKPDSLRPFCVRIVSPGVYSTAQQRLEDLKMEGIDIKHVNIDPSGRGRWQ